MRFASIIGLAALAGSVVPALTGQQAGPAGSAPASCTGPFVKVASPSPGSSDNVLFATAAAGPGHMWAVGRRYSGTNYRNLILSNAGHGWSQVTAPNPGSTNNQLTAVRPRDPRTPGRRAGMSPATAPSRSPRRPFTGMAPPGPRSRCRRCLLSSIATPAPGSWTYPRPMLGWSALTSAGARTCPSSRTGTVPPGRWSPTQPPPSPSPRSPPAAPMTSGRSARGLALRSPR